MNIKFGGKTVVSRSMSCADDLPPANLARNVSEEILQIAIEI